ncbi:MAG: hypothetical protein JRJ14_07415 [Deltaproteobacteria bacterium]|nr:hypothetical protein [Deltaproteobacteria bacterium]
MRGCEVDIGANLLMMVADCRHIFQATQFITLPPKKTWLLFSNLQVINSNIHAIIW